MSFPSSPRVPSGPRRRSLLASAAGAALLAGCSGGSGSDTAPAPSADERARARAARDSEVLAARYDAVIAAHPGLAARLRPLRDEVVRHAEAFGGARTTSPEASPSGTARAAGPGDGSAVPVTEKDALAGLAAAERELADRRAGALLEAPGESARLLASVAAAGAAHMFLLTEGHG
ncbi:hypothetical protein [Streptomyces flaveolus]|uniref:hypothetical protein n=1 Tax=Streptomyces flaveolus TaxID=67297 RepID=UPI0033FD312A